MRRIIKEKDDIKVSIFSGGRLVRVFIDSGYRNIAMVIADCGRIANGCYHIHHIEVVNMDRGCMREIIIRIEVICTILVKE